ncbi:MAG TPA: hypothetical protein DEO65_16545 [Bacillus bacterium]|uniref:Uncharacterized protein n=1 Tax=Siminovitchia fordii TaxID=254759 RepID=A0ABQ4K454_9BACI|nr:hypothetical protein [Siminovitchia fordii]GIN19648.1 hypothetical protein J1TS3_07820 [Siminovitchia fordii]HBZ11446.1 hypothetical protein [Bacillus sp. (in: firmicutes)]
MKWYSIGSLSFPASWAAISAALICAYVYTRLQRKNMAADIFSNAFFIFLLTWKLSVILFQFKTVYSNPFAVVYFNGGIKGYWLGITIAFLYLFFAEKKLDSQEKDLLMEVWIVIITVYELVYYLLNKWHILLSGFQLIGSVVFLMLLRRNFSDKVWSIQILVLFTCFQGLIYSLAGNILSVPMATYTFGTLILGWAAWKGSRKKQ